MTGSVLNLGCPLKPPGELFTFLLEYSFDWFTMLCYYAELLKRQMLGPSPGDCGSLVWGSLGIRSFKRFPVIWVHSDWGSLLDRVLSSPTEAAGEAVVPSATCPASPPSVFRFPLSPWLVASYPLSLCPEYSTFFLFTWPTSHCSHPSVLFSQNTLNFLFTTLSLLCTYVFSCDLLSL